jgi:hypothetical protein
MKARGDEEAKSYLGDALGYILGAKVDSDT